MKKIAIKILELLLAERLLNVREIAQDSRHHKTARVIFYMKYLARENVGPKHSRKSGVNLTCDLACLLEEEKNAHKTLLFRIGGLI